MKRLIGLPLFLTLSLAAHAGTESVTPDQPVFIPRAFNQPVFIPPTPAPSGAAPAQQAAAEGAAEGAAASQADVDALGARISRQISTAQVFCARVPLADYRVDCLSDQLSQIAGTVPEDADFGTARSILAETADKLARVARSSPSTTRRPAQLTAPEAPSAGSNRPIVPVDPADLPQATADADRILDEARTLLLRASETSDRRKVAYAQMAEAVGSTKILLRSN